MLFGDLEPFFTLSGTRRTSIFVSEGPEKEYFRSFLNVGGLFYSLLLWPVFCISPIFYCKI